MILLLVGESRSGKDTIADKICLNYGGVKIAFADPIKRYLKWLFYFSDDQLWGPREIRNANDLRDPKVMWDQAEERFSAAHDHGISYMFGSDWTASGLIRHLESWFAAHKGETVSPRLLMQTLGTECGRNWDPHIWSCYTIGRVANSLIEGGYTYDHRTGLMTNDRSFGYPLVVISDGRHRNEIISVKRESGKVWKVVNPRQTKSDLEGTTKNHSSETQQRTIPNFWFDVEFINDKSRDLDELEDYIEDAMIGANLVDVPWTTDTRKSLDDQDDDE